MQVIKIIRNWCCSRWEEFTNKPDTFFYIFLLFKFNFSAGLADYRITSFKFIFWKIMCVTMVVHFSKDSSSLWYNICLTVNTCKHMLIFYLRTWNLNHINFSTNFLKINENVVVIINTLVCFMSTFFMEFMLVSFYR